MIATSTIQIRRATILDLNSISTLLDEAFAEFKPLYTPAAYAATTPTVEQIYVRWAEGPIWVAMQNSRLIATVAAVPKTSGLYVRSMAVHSECRGRGVAKQLLREIESFAMENHHQRLFLSTTPFLGAAIHVYEQFGFGRTDEEPHDLFGTPLFTMVKPLQTTAIDTPDKEPG